ncbi:radical SAM protein [Clostridium rectalis]|uniref:radical SAM protein n=1 Tax=Clostridium rectalis TaxID=2040295 RepID=UPI000F62F459|nr:radical SAM protein [Clostridium rectalis]
MRYEGIVYRPPSEAYSLIIQATIGCAHNKCTFCNMYKGKKFRIRNIEEIFKDLEIGRKTYNKVEKIFLADGDAMSIPTEGLKQIISRMKVLFPECKRIGIYATPKDILRKSLKELKDLNKLGLGIIYMGVESGSDKILKKVKKGATQDDIVKAGKKIKESGILLSITLISGLGGKENLIDHAIESGKVITHINPDYVGLLTLMLQPGTEIERESKIGGFKLLSPKEVMKETKLMLENISVTNCIFRSNHASNYVSLSGNLPWDKQNIISKIDSILKNGYSYKGEIFRGL